MFDATLVPAPFTAYKRRLYDMSFTRPVIVRGEVLPDASYKVSPDGSVEYLYPITSELLVLAGAVKATLKLAFQGITDVMTGAEGGAYKMNTGKTAEGGELPAGVPA